MNENECSIKDIENAIPYINDALTKIGIEYPITSNQLNYFVDFIRKKSSKIIHRINLFLNFKTYKPKNDKLDYKFILIIIAVWMYVNFIKENKNQMNKQKELLISLLEEGFHLIKKYLQKLYLIEYIYLDNIKDIIKFFSHFGENLYYEREKLNLKIHYTIFSFPFLPIHFSLELFICLANENNHQIAQDIKDSFTIELLNFILEQLSNKSKYYIDYIEQTKFDLFKFTSIIKNNNNNIITNIIKEIILQTFPLYKYSRKENDKLINTLKNLFINIRRKNPMELIEDLKVSHFLLDIILEQDKKEEINKDQLIKSNTIYFSNKDITMKLLNIEFGENGFILFFKLGIEILEPFESTFPLISFFVNHIKFFLIANYITDNNLLAITLYREDEKDPQIQFVLTDFHCNYIGMSFSNENILVYIATLINNEQNINIIKTKNIEFQNKNRLNFLLNEEFEDHNKKILNCNFYIGPILVLDAFKEEENNEGHQNKNSKMLQCLIELKEDYYKLPYLLFNNQNKSFLNSNFLIIGRILKMFEENHRESDFVQLYFSPSIVYREIINVKTGYLDCNFFGNTRQLEIEGDITKIHLIPMGKRMRNIFINENGIHFLILLFEYYYQIASHISLSQSEYKDSKDIIKENL